MAKKREEKREIKRDKKRQDDKALNRRDFFRSGAAAGVGAAVLSTGAVAQENGAQGIRWNYEADVVILGSGCVGLHAAVRARDLGASVLVIDQNFDVGGKLVHSGGWTSLGGGDAIQERDRMGTDPQGLGLKASLIKPEDLEDDPDRLFRDMTDWSVVDATGVARYRYNDRELHRAWADNAPKTRQFMMDNYVRFARIDGTHQGGGMTRARAARAMMKLADKTDIKAGTVSPHDRGDPQGERHSHFAPMRQVPGVSAESLGAPGWVWGGFSIARPMEFSAREKGVRFMLNRHMDELIRERPFSGRVIGVKARYTPRTHPETGARLESFWQNGNIDERGETVYIRARKAVIIATGGMQGSIPMRMMMDPRMSEPSIEYGPSALIGPMNMDGSGIMAGMKIGACLAGMMQNYQHSSGSPTLSSVLGTRDTVGSTFPGTPAFLFARAKGFNIGNAGWEHAIAVNQVGQRFYNERSINTNSSDAKYPPGSDGTRKEFVPLDWRNASPQQVNAQNRRSAAVDAALAINEGSRAPDFGSGPVWAIFDAAAVARGGWRIRYPYIADPPDGYFHKADTLAELAKKVMGHPYQKMPLKHLEKTVARYNEMAGRGKDEDFEKPVLHRIETPPFYAAAATIRVNDSYGGLRINGKGQVLDTQGQVIPGLYSGGEASGGGAQHGIGRATVHGYIAGTNAAQEPVA
jgi:succinate dehydrogenase/fumarate reductase flavoprotein subunit